jgi:hypothetical protein
MCIQTQQQLVCVDSVNERQCPEASGPQMSTNRTWHTQTLAIIMSLCQINTWWSDITWRRGAIIGGRVLHQAHARFCGGVPAGGAFAGC